MIVSRKFGYVYIGIPRTGSNSMMSWLCDNYGGEGVAFHHSSRVPEEFQDFFIFTIVRNPYQRELSSLYAFYLEEKDQREREKAIANFDWPRFQEENVPRKDGTEVIDEHNVPEVRMNQYYYCQKAGVSLALNFENLPSCLRELPFVSGPIPPFPHRNPAQSERRPGNFFDFFKTDEAEAAVWEYAREDFDAFGYRRYDCGGPGASHNSFG